MTLGFDHPKAILRCNVPRNDSASCRRREGESYNHIIERLLAENTEADFYDGFGMLSDEEADWIREKREAAKEKRKDRMRRLEKT